MTEPVRIRRMLQRAGNRCKPGAKADAEYPSGVARPTAFARSKRRRFFAVTGNAYAGMPYWVVCEVPRPGFVRDEDFLCS